MAKKKVDTEAANRKKAVEKLIKARIFLTRKEPFFGTLCLHMTMEENWWVPTAGTDGDKLYYNYEFINKLPAHQVAGVLIHEVIHAAMGHIWRRGKRNKHKFNIAADYATNLIITDNGYELPPGCLLDQRYKGMNAEKIYDKLPPLKHVCAYCGKTLKDKEKSTGGGGEGKKDEKNKKKKNKGSGKDKGKKQSQQTGGGGKEGKQKKKQKGKGSGRGKRSDAKSPGHRCCASHAFWDKPGGEKLSKKQMRRLRRKWKAAMEDANYKSRGSTPAGFEREVEKLKPKENWRKILSTYLSQAMTDFDFMKRDRRLLDQPFYLPDLGNEDSLKNVVFVLDTSGSISQTELSQFVSEIKNLMKYFPQSKGWVMDCDAQVGQIIPLEDMNKPKSKNWYGGGGTSHVPVFREIKKKAWTPKVVVCFTDLYTEFPKTKPTYPVLWLVPKDNYDKDEKVPFGRLIVMQS